MDKITPTIDFKNELAELNDVKGKVAYLPGGYGGIGEAIAWGLALRGARVVVSGRSKQKAETPAAQLTGQGMEAMGLSVDAKSVSEIKDSVEAVVEKFGALDILVNCIGIQREEPLLDVTEEAFDEVYQSNLKSAMSWKSRNLKNSCLIVFRSVALRIQRMLSDRFSFFVHQPRIL